MQCYICCFPRMKCFFFHFYSRRGKQYLQSYGVWGMKKKMFSFESLTQIHAWMMNTHNTTLQLWEIQIVMPFIVACVTCTEWNAATSRISLFCVKCVFIFLLFFISMLLLLLHFHTYEICFGFSSAREWSAIHRLHQWTVSLEASSFMVLFWENYCENCIC